LALDRVPVSIVGDQIVLLEGPALER
jgi:hypothetical protein